MRVDGASSQHGVQRPEDIVVWHLPVEGGDQAGETVLANRGTAQFATRYFVLYLG